MTITARTPTTGTDTGNGTGTTITVTKPTGTIDGDLIAVAICSDGTSTGTDWAPSPSTGWTSRANLNPTLDGQWFSVWTRIAASEGASWTFGCTNHASGNDETWGAMAWGGVDAGTPFDATAVTTVNSTSNASVANVALTGITTVTAGSLLVYIAGGDPNSASTGTWGTPSGFTNRVSSYSNFAPLKIADMVQAVAGASGTITGTLTFTGGNAGFAGVMLAIRDANPPGVQFDAAGNSGDQAATNTYSGSASWSGANRLLAIDVSMLGPGVTVSSMTYGGAACTFVGAISTVTSFGRVEQWRIASSDSGAPATGSNTLVVNLSGSLEFTVEWASYTGVHQTSPTEGFNSAQATNAGSATDASVAVTSVADNCWIHAAVVANDTSITAGNTTRNNVAGTLGSGANEDNGAAKTPAGSVTMSYSGMGITTTWAIAGYAIRPIAASGLGRLFRSNPSGNLSGLGASGPFFQNPLQ